MCSTRGRPESCRVGAIARAWANNLKIILAAEPTASLDTDRALATMHAQRQISRQNGAAVLIVTHDHRLIGEVDRAIEMVDGQIVGTRPPPAVS